jgi:hypothetical protein
MTIIEALKSNDVSLEIIHKGKCLYWFNGLWHVDEGGVKIIETESEELAVVELLKD